jgi:PDZ domain
MRSMRSPSFIVLAGIAAALVAAIATSAHAQSNDNDQTLEIAPRIPAPPAAVSALTPSASDSGARDQSAAGPSSAAPPDDSATANQKRPYLGIGVQTIFSDDQPARVVTGLEVVSVDRDSPADLAGLRGRTKMTSLGESGATAGALIPPLDLVMMPLLKKTGALGQGGDLIVAIDDRRVTNELDLQNELASLKPDDTIYFTIVRTAADGTKRTLKLPVKLADAARAVANSDGSSDSSPSSNAPARAASAVHP